MCQPLAAFRAKVNNEPRWFSVNAIVPERDFILYDCQLLTGVWRLHLSGSLQAFCERTAMEVASA